MGFERTKLTTTKKLADSKLHRLGIRLDYRVEPTDGESYATDQGAPIYLNHKDRDCSSRANKGSVNLLLHELGHKFLYQKMPESVRKSKDFTRLFGKFFKVYRRKPGTKKDHPNFLSKYAQAHPQEDFAEVFSVYTELGGNMTKIRQFITREKKGQLVLDQFHWLDNYISRLRAT